MTEIVNERESLRERTDEPASVVHHAFREDAIVWKHSERTQIPSHLLNDPFIRGTVKYFNSVYFSLEVDQPFRHKQAFEFLLSVLEKEGLEEVPSERIYSLCLSHLLKTDWSEHTRYRLYTYMRSPARKMATSRSKVKKVRNLALLRQIPLSDGERAAVVQAHRMALDLRQPGYDAPPDLIEYLGLDSDADELLKSLRAFCAFFILEWRKIRNAIFNNFPKEVAEFIEFASSIPKKAPGSLGPSQPELESMGRSVDGCFKITERINHPLLTERFVVEYLGPLTAKDSISAAAKEIWDFSSCTSTSANINWLEKIPEQYRNHTLGRLCDPAYWRNLRCGSERYQTLEKDWIGSVHSVFPVRSLLGQSRSEQICMAWIFASDRHQPSNLRWMTVEDLASTDNSISTILDPHTIKRRASRTSGTPYDEIDGKESGFGAVEGGTYKRTQLIYNAITAHRDQLIEAAKNGLLSGETPLGDVKDLWFFSEIRESKDGKPGDGHLRVRYFKFWQKNFLNFELLLCAMDGSLSNQYVLEHCPEAELFLKAVRKAFLSADGVLRKTGVLTSHVARLAVNSANGKLYSEGFTPLSGNNDAAISNDAQLSEMVRDAALHNHSVSTKLSVYADKLPAYITKSSRFGARVGEEMVEMASQLGKLKLGSTSLMTMSELRKTLGTETVAERELEQINELLTQVDLEGYVVDELGLATDGDGKTVLIRHPITIALIQSALDSLDRQLSRLEYSNEERLLKALIRYMYLKMLLSEKFTPTEIKEASELYSDVEFPMSDILV